MTAASRWFADEMLRVAAVAIASVVGEDELAMAFWKGLWEEGVFTTPALPPGVPNGQSIIRTSVNANHTSDQLDRLLSAFAIVGRRLGVI